MEDAEFLKQVAVEKKVKKAVIVGGGLIGMETCEALQLAGIETTVVEMLDQILPFLDWEMYRSGSPLLQWRSTEECPLQTW